MTDPVPRLLERLEHVKGLGAGWMARCPAHDDRQNSLKIDVGDEGQALLHCHTGCSTEDIVRKLGMEMKDLYPPRREAILNNGHSPHVVGTTRYPLLDAAGGIVAVHVRRDMSDSTKKVHWEQANGQMGLGGRKLTDFPLYGIHALGDTQDVLLVEGEKACDAALEMDAAAVATVTGASGTPGDEALRPLIGRTVYLWPDNDDPGRKHMERIGSRLLALGQAPEAIRLMEWVKAPEKGDIADWRDAGGNAALLQTKMAKAPQWSAQDEEFEEPIAETPRSRSHAEILDLELPPERHLVAGLLEEGTGCILAGPGGIGKTWLSLDLARSIASGTPWLGHFVTAQAPVLVIDEEGNERGIRDRLRLLNAAQPLEDPPLWFAIGLGLKVDALNTERVIQEEIERYQPGVVIFDSLTRMHSANENDASEMSQVFARFSTLRRLYGCTVVLIDHLRKKGLINDEAEMLRGSTDKRNWPDTILFVSAAEAGTMTVSHIKSRYGKAVPDFSVGIEIDNEAGSGRIRYQGQAPSQSVVKGGEIIAAIHSLKAQLGEDGASPMTVAAWLDISENTVRKYVKGLVAASIIRTRRVTTDGRPKEVYDVQGGVS